MNARPPLVPLPIDTVLPELVAHLRASAGLVLEAPPGAGKTTRVPRAMLDAGFADEGELVVLQPRRIAARMAARRVADELGEKLGETVGYTVRFEDASSARTKVRFVTEGVLTRRVLSDPTLRGVSAVLLDEFHERHLDGDVALALLRRLQHTTRPSLRIVVMSATLDAAPVRGFLGDVPVLRSEGRRFDVAIEHLARPDDRPLAQQVASALGRLCSEGAGLEGDVLVFLPGAGEIRRAGEACAALARKYDLLLLPLHGELSPQEQDRAVRPAEKRKVILSTNVAETSVTIDGVVAVIDSGLARIASHAPWSGLPTLRVGRVSRASATQRAGRAGRTREGRCLRLYTKHDFDTRPAFEAPEIARLDLSQTVLDLRASGVRDLHDRGDFSWFEAPPPGAVTAAEALLARLGALDASGALTVTGRSMLRFAVHPRLARIVCEAEARALGDDGCLLAALASERDLRVQGAPGERAARARGPAMHARSDLLEQLEAFDEAERAEFDEAKLRWLGLDPNAVRRVDRVYKQLRRSLRKSSANAQPPTGELRERELLMSILAGYADRVGRLRRPGNHTGRAHHGIEVVFAQGGTAKLADASVVQGEELVCALDVEERSEADARGSQVTVKSASAVESDWLLELCTESVRDAEEVRFNPQTERVEVLRRLSYDALVLEETPVKHGDPARVARVLCDAARARGGLRAFAGDVDALDRFVARVNFVRAQVPSLAIAPLDEGALDAALLSLCEGALTLADLRRADALEALRGRLDATQLRAVHELAPERIELPGGRRVRVEYPPDAPPWIESRLQDFFGLKQGPTVVNGRVPVVLHLNAPNQRAVQVTTDLAGFWDRHYPAIAKELRRKYPKHKWPDDPRTAEPPPVLPPRPRG